MSVHNLTMFCDSTAREPKQGYSAHAAVELSDRRLAKSVMLEASQVGADSSGAIGKPRAGLLDTRAYQELEPLQLPSKLRDRITRAQRRAAAEKDGISIFTSNVVSESLQINEKEVARTSPTSRPANDADGAMGQKGAQRQRKTLALAGGDIPNPVSKEKMHLPDVIIGHKMREFEAKMNLNALFVDPLENNLHHLSIDDKERVMMRMQEKIQGITSQIEAHFVQIKEELDSNGIFDSAANYQRAQALCLVEVQKRCKLEKLRDEAMREVLDENGGASQATMTLMEGKLNDLLTDKQQKSGEKIDTSAQLAFSHLQKTTKSFALKRRPAATKRTLSPVKSKLPPSRSGNQLTHENNSKVVADARTELTADTNVALVANAVQPTEDWTSRHPHIVQAIQFLATTGVASVLPVSSNDTLESFSSRGEHNISDSAAPAADSRLQSRVEDWLERSSCYQVIAARALEELLRRWSRWRWDSTKHFHNLSNNPLRSVDIVIPDELHRRLLLRRATASARQRDEEERTTAIQETNTEKRKKAELRYQQLQESVHARRQEREKRAQGSSKRVSTANSRTNSSRVPLADKIIEPRRAVTAENGYLGIARKNNSIDAEKSSAPPAQSSEARDAAQGDPSAGMTNRGSLVMSASAPLLSTIASISTPAGEPQGVFNRTFRDRKLPVISPQMSRRSRVRGDSLIGGRNSLDLNTLGHFSNARIEERRDSAQTWAWHHPQTRVRPSALQLVSEEDGLEEDQESDVDASERRDGVGEAMSEDNEGEGDGDSEDGESGDDARSVRSSLSSRHVMDSARSSFSVVSKKTAYASLRGEDAVKPRYRGKGKALKSPKRHRSPNAKKRPNGTVHGPRGSRLLSRPSNSSNLSGSSGGMFAGVHFTANAQVMQHRLEEIWNALDFPFSAKLIMLEKYASLADPDALSHALSHWEKMVDMVLLREKLRHIVDEFQELDDLKASSRLTPGEWSYMLMHQIEIPPNAINLSSKDLAEWTRTHFDAVTQRCEKMAQQLKASTGDELTFQGHRYPPRV